VKYIVENTLTPIIEEKKQEWFGTLGDFCRGDPLLSKSWTRRWGAVTSWWRRQTGWPELWFSLGDGATRDESEETAEFDIHLASEKSSGAASKAWT
jgi:hypothetical protein